MKWSDIRARTADGKVEVVPAGLKERYSLVVNVASE